MDKLNYYVVEVPPLDPEDPYTNTPMDLLLARVLGSTTMFTMEYVDDYELSENSTGPCCRYFFWATAEEQFEILQNYNDAMPTSNEEEDTE